MLIALPELYEPPVSSVAYRTEIPTLSELTALLLNEEIRREVRTSKRESEVLLVQSKNKGYQPRKYSGRNHQYPRKLSIVPKEMGACHFCGGKDHFMRNWQQKLNDEEQTSEETILKTLQTWWITSPTMENFFSDVSEVLEAQIASMEFGKGKWYLDNGILEVLSLEHFTFEESFY